MTRRTALPSERAPVPIAARRVRWAWVRYPLHWWWLGIGFALAALIGNVVILPLTTSPENLGPAILNQVDTLVTLARTAPVATGAVLVGLTALTAAAYGGHKSLEREAAAYATEMERRRVEEVARKQAEERLVDLLRSSSSVALTAGGISVVKPIGMPRVDQLIGRTSEVELLVKTLRAHHTAGVCALEGMGGIGKSALAAHVTEILAEDHDAFPGGAAWIPCDNLWGEDGLAELWTRIARLIGVDSVADERDANQRLVLLTRALSQRNRTLLTLDNLEPGLRVETVVRHLAIPGCVALLLTARQQIEAELDRQLTLHPLPRSDGAELFLHRYSVAAEHELSSSDKKYLDELAVALGGLPLAIELTAAYAGRQGLAVRNVLDEIRTENLSAYPLADPERGLRSCFARSWRILPAEQQRLFAGLSIFTGATFPRSGARELALAAIALVPGSERRYLTGPAPLAKTRIQTTSYVTTNSAVSLLRPSGELCVSALVDAALVEALPIERLRLHPFLRDYGREQLNALSGQEVETLGGAVVDFWKAFVRANVGEFADLAIQTESAGLQGALDWARGHLLAESAESLAEALRASAGRHRRHYSPFVRLTPSATLPLSAAPPGVWFAKRSTKESASR